MTAWTGEIIGMGGEGKYPPADGKRVYRGAPVRDDLYDKYFLKSAQSQGLQCVVWIPKSVTVAENDTLTLTVKTP